MKKTYLYCLVSLGLAISMVAGNAFAQMPGVYASKAGFVNLETPFRCSVKKIGDLDVATTVALKPGDFKLTFFDKMDALPRYEVNGLSFTKQPIDEALQQLVEEADITVYTEDGFYPTMDADSVYGELNDVVDGLTEAAEIFYRYDARKKEMYLSRRGRFELQLPDNRVVMLAMLDALRGAGIGALRPDWQTNTILMSLTTSEKQTVEELLGFIEQDGYLLLADTQVFTALPRSKNSSWQKVVRQFGASQTHAANNGLRGQILVIGNQIPQQQFMTRVSSDFFLTPVTQGVAIVPNGWKMRFNVGQCAVTRNQLASLSILLNARIQSPEKVETGVTIDSQQGEISTFNTVTAIDNELVVIGVPSPESPSDELLITIKLRLIRLAKEK